MRLDLSEARVQVTTIRDLGSISGNWKEEAGALGESQLPISDKKRREAGAGQIGVIRSKSDNEAC